MKKSVAALVTVILLAAVILSACAPAAQGKKLIAAIDATYPPFEQLNEKTGEIEGFDVDLMNAVAAKAGLDIEYVNVSFDKLLEGVAGCKYDLACSSISITEDRKKVLLFSDYINSGGQVVIARAGDTDIRGKDDLNGRIVGVLTASTGAIEAIKIPGVTLQTSISLDRLFQDLLDKKVDAAIADNMVSAYFISKNPGKLKQAGGIFTDEKDGIAICKKNEYLVPKINAALKELKDDGTLDSLKSKWITSE